MSWQSYVDDQLISTKMIKHAVICGHDGSIWASSADFKVDFDNNKRAEALSLFPFYFESLFDDPKKKANAGRFPGNFFSRENKDFALIFIRRFFFSFRH